MYQKKLQIILKEEWLQSNTWHSNEKSNQKNFHLALQRVHKELPNTPSTDNFKSIVNKLVDDPSKSKDIEVFSQKAQIMFNYYKIINSENSFS